MPNENFSIIGLTCAIVGVILSIKALYNTHAVKNTLTQKVDKFISDKTNCTPLRLDPIEHMTLNEAVCVIVDPDASPSILIDAFTSFFKSYIERSCKYTTIKLEMLYRLTIIPVIRKKLSDGQDILAPYMAMEPIALGGIKSMPGCIQLNQSCFAITLCNMADKGVTAIWKDEPYRVPFHALATDRNEEKSIGMSNALQRRFKCFTSLYTLANAIDAGIMCMIIKGENAQSVLDKGASVVKDEPSSSDKDCDNEDVTLEDTAALIDEKSDLEVDMRTIVVTDKDFVDMPQMITTDIGFANIPLSDITMDTRLAIFDNDRACQIGYENIDHMSYEFFRHPTNGHRYWVLRNTDTGSQTVLRVNDRVLIMNAATQNQMAVVTDRSVATLSQILKCGSSHIKNVKIVHRTENGVIVTIDADHFAIEPLAKSCIITRPHVVDDHYISINGFIVQLYDERKAVRK